MEGESSFDFENIVYTPSDAGFPFPSPSYDLPPVQPSHMNIDPRQSPIAVAIQSWVPPDLSSTPTDLELLENYLGPVLRPPGLPEEPSWVSLVRWKKRKFNPAVVNAGLPSMNPWELSGIMAGKQGRREKYYLTDYPQLCNVFKDKLETPDGFWIKEGSGSLLRSNAGVGYKKTYIWNNTDEMKTNWIMNVYAVVKDNNLQDDLVLCHVFEAAPDYNAKPKCPTSVQGRCSGKHHHEGINASTNTLFSSIPPGSSPIQHGPCQSDDPRLTSFIADLGKFLLRNPDPDPDSSMDTENCSPTIGVSPTEDPGKSHNRKKISDVWDYFTKIYARDLKGNVVTLAACNHCSKVLTGDSKNGTRHLRDHTCPCKFKPVQAGRMDKGYSTVNVLSS